MRKNLCFLLVIFTLAACHNKNQETNNSLNEVGKEQSSLIQAYQKTDSLRLIGAVDVAASEDFVRQAWNFYEKYPEEKITPEMLTNSAIASMTLAKYYKEMPPGDIPMKIKHAEHALLIFNTLIKVYPDYEGIKVSYLNKGIVYDDILEDYLSADMEYREYIHKYPHDSVSVNLSNYLPFLGKTADEIFEEIQKKNS